MLFKKKKNPVYLNHCQTIRINETKDSIRWNLTFCRNPEAVLSLFEVIGHYYHQYIVPKPSTQLNKSKCHNSACLHIYSTKQSFHYPCHHFLPMLKTPNNHPLGLITLQQCKKPNKWKVSKSLEITKKSQGTHSKSLTPFISC